MSQRRLDMSRALLDAMGSVVVIRPDTPLARTITASYRTRNEVQDGYVVSAEYIICMKSDIETPLRDKEKVKLSDGTIKTVSGAPEPDDAGKIRVPLR
jgi:hypothetical protein